MKVHYINILLFALPLNILVTLYHVNSPHKKPHTTPHHTPTTRFLCECELYAPANYESDPQMKEVMDNFNKQTQQRFHEYDQRMKTTRQKCKDKCDKESQKIILKDKMEKELTEKFATLHTDITTEDIPTCVCEKSLADKVEKGCLKCGGILGTAAPEFGLIGGNFVHAAAVKSSVDWGIKIGMETAISDLKVLSALGRLIGNTKIETFVTSKNYFHKMSIIQFLQKVNIEKCQNGSNANQSFCNFVTRNGVTKLVERGASIAEEAQLMGAEAASEKFAQMTNAGAIFSDPVVISAIVVVTIAVILLIIYLILRYRRKKKIKKKVQYIKLLNQ
ncbi:rifin PIR protein, putative [Plasmodium reichenowi]|uniref:Rifin PIR protein, putative n=1 Tax=Plasmodium reichenowi TaxID=5854 RepID=A0A2P9D8L1_PLARE|nr:rifin PIR protein, putative [Plasmodium reichenowi]